jgi:hypothetical protein
MCGACRQITSLFLNTHFGFVGEDQVLAGGGSSMGYM